jgi:hypothetical protein
MSSAETSRDARASIDAGQLRARVLAGIKASGNVGRTCDELEMELGLPHQTCSARVYELAKRGEITDSRRTRKTRNDRAAVVWIENVPRGGQQRLL